MARFGLVACLVLATLAFQGGRAAAQQAQRIALVIGNSTYTEAPLKNPVNDARAMSAALRSRGFQVITRENATKSQMESAVADFGEKLTEGATGLFFFAGHGMQVQGRNFLVPVDAKITSEQRVRLETLDVDMVLDQMQGARVKVSMVILDACRNNPFERRFRSVGGGLAQINAPEGTLIAYATSPGKVAADGDADNGLYTQEFLKALTAPGLKVEDVFKQVRINVSRASNGMQVPWEASSLTGDFYFVPPAPVAPVAAVAAVAPMVAPAPAPAPNPQSLDLAFWDAVKGSNSAEELKAYLDTFPSGTFAPLARARMAALNRPAVAAAAPARTAPTETPPAPTSQPQQQAALPAPTAPLAAGSFDGRYSTKILFGRGIDVSIEITGTTIKGFGVSGSGVCAVSGAIDAAGVIQRFDMTCPQSTWAFAGRFNDAGSTSENTAKSSALGTRQVVWAKTGS
jgi:uncharacterized caspase-like protein